jgi:hypothetical protein
MPSIVLKKCGGRANSRWQVKHHELVKEHAHNFWNSVWFSFICSYAYSLLHTSLNMHIKKIEELRFTLRVKILNVNMNIVL